MTDATITPYDRIAVSIDEDGMKAVIRLQVSGEASPPSVEEVQQALSAAGVRINDAVRERVEEFVRLSTAGSASPSNYLVASGTPPTDGVGERFVWSESVEQQAKEWTGDERSSGYDVEAIVVVEEGSIIGSIRPLEPPRDGVTVTGDAIKATGEPRNIELHESVQRDENGGITANRTGRVVRDDWTLRIEETTRITGDFVAHTDTMCDEAHVHVDGAVVDNAELKSKKGVTVAQAIEDAKVEAGGDIVVGGGIVGRGQGHVIAGGAIVARFGNEACLNATGDLRISKQLMNCRVRVCGQLAAEAASVIGGTVFIGCGGVVASLGSESDVPTRVFLGPDPGGLKQAADIDEKLKPMREAAARIRLTVEPLMANLKRLAPTQREQATELMFKAEEIEAHIAEQEAQRDQLAGIGEDVPVPKLRIVQTVYPKVVISVGTRLTRFERELTGPVTIEQRKVRNVSELVAVGDDPGMVSVLTSRRVPIEQILNEYKPVE